MQRTRRIANETSRSCVLESSRWVTLRRPKRIAYVRVTAVRARNESNYVAADSTMTLVGANGANVSLLVQVMHLQ